MSANYHWDASQKGGQDRRRLRIVSTCMHTIEFIRPWLSGVSTPWANLNRASDAVCIQPIGTSPFCAALKTSQVSCQIEQALVGAANPNGI